MKRVILALMLLGCASINTPKRKSLVEEIPKQEKYDFGFYYEGKLVSPRCVGKAKFYAGPSDLGVFKKCLAKNYKIKVGRLTNYPIGSDQNYIIHEQFEEHNNVYLVLYNYDKQKDEFVLFETFYVESKDENKHMKYMEAIEHKFKLEFKDDKIYTKGKLAQLYEEGNYNDY